MRNATLIQVVPTDLIDTFWDPLTVIPSNPGSWLKSIISTKVPWGHKTLTGLVVFAQSYNKASITTHAIFYHG